MVHSLLESIERTVKLWPLDFKIEWVTEHRAKAQDVVQDEHSEYLNAEQVVAICDVFEMNTHTADTFLNYKKFEYCKAWVEMQLKRAGFPMDNTTIDNSQ